MRFQSGVRAIAIVAVASLLSACVSSVEPQPRPSPQRPTAQRPAPTKPRPTVTRPATQPAVRPATYPSRPVASSDEAPYVLRTTINSLWKGFPSRAGIAVIREDADWVVSERGGEPMPQQSVSKLWVAITLLDKVDQGDISLAEPVTVRKSDLVVFSAAMASMIGENGYTTTLGGLLERAMLKSDNTANDLLLKRVGGSQAVRAMIAAKGLGAIRFSAGENLLQAGTAGLPWREEYRQGKQFQAARALLSLETRRQAMDAYVANPPDGAAPIAIARALLRLARGELLSASSTRRLTGLMTASETGKQRLRAGVPYGWSFGHKTGTGQDLGGRTAGYNDVGFMVAPDGTRYAVVVQIADTAQPIIARMQFMQAISAAVAANHSP